MNITGSDDKNDSTWFQSVMTISDWFLKGNLLEPVHSAEGNEEEHCGNHKSQKPGNLEKKSKSSFSVFSKNCNLCITVSSFFRTTNEQVITISI